MVYLIYLVLVLENPINGGKNNFIDCQIGIC